MNTGTEANGGDGAEDGVSDASVVPEPRAVDRGGDGHHHGDDDDQSGEDGDDRLGVVRPREDDRQCRQRRPHARAGDVLCVSTVALGELCGGRHHRPHQSGGDDGREVHRHGAEERTQTERGGVGAGGVQRVDRTADDHPRRQREDDPPVERRVQNVQHRQHERGHQRRHQQCHRLGRERQSAHRVPRGPLPE